MAEYIRLAGGVPGMPTIRRDGREWLRDGERLLRAIGLSGSVERIACLWQAAPSVAAPDGSERFTAERAASLGSDLRLVTFDRTLSSSAERDWLSAWPTPPSRLGDAAYGWFDASVEGQPAGEDEASCRACGRVEGDLRG